jgi:arylsulfatase A-like enzyme
MIHEQLDTMAMPRYENGPPHRRGRALLVGVAGSLTGVAMGFGEGLLVVRDNSFVQPDQYFAVYLAVPILTWMAIGAVLGALVIAVTFGVRRVAGRDPRGIELPFAVGAVVLAGSGWLAASWTGNVIAELHEVGFPFTASRVLVLLAAPIVASAALAAAAAGAAFHWRAVLERHLPRAGLGLASVVATLCVWPLLRFATDDWKVSSAPATAVEPEPLRGEHPNVLLISIDTLRADHLGSYGSPFGLTPNLDRLAAEGVALSQAVTTSPWTLPAIASLHTALLPRHHGAGWISNRRDPLGRSPLPPSLWTLAGALSESGYRTGAVVTNPYLSLRYGLGAGFDDYTNVTIESEAFLSFRRTAAMAILRLLRPEVSVGDRGARVSARALSWIERVSRETSAPYFLWVHYVDPHSPYSAPEATDHKSFRGDSLLGGGRGFLGARGPVSPDVARLRSGELRLSEPEKEEVRALYRAEVAGVDAAVGDLLDGLRRLGLEEHTLVVAVSDHGEEFWEHGGVEHGHTVYEEVVRVPALLRWPRGLPAGGRVESVVSLVDLAPTIADLAGAPLPDGADGRSLALLLRGGALPERAAMVESMLFAEERIGVRTATHKLVRWGDGRVELYDLWSDPGERGAPAEPALLADLGELAEVPTFFLTAEIDPDRDDPAAAHALRALGYLR